MKDERGMQQFKAWGSIIIKSCTLWSPMHHYHYQRMGQTWNMYSLAGLGLGGPAGQVGQLVRSCCYRSCSDDTVWLLKSLRLFHVLRTRAILTMRAPSTGRNRKQNKGTTDLYILQSLSQPSVTESVIPQPINWLIFKCRTQRIFGKIKTNHPSHRDAYTHTEEPTVGIATHNEKPPIHFPIIPARDEAIRLANSTQPWFDIRHDHSKM